MIFQRFSIIFQRQRAEDGQVFEKQGPERMENVSRYENTSGGGGTFHNIQGTNWVVEKPNQTKVPVGRQNGVTHSWGIPHLLNACREDLGCDLGMVVDLCNTEKWYSPEEFKEAGVAHVKIPIGGKKVISQQIIAQCVIVFHIFFFYRFLLRVK